MEREALDRDAFLAKHPKIAADLREFLEGGGELKCGTTAQFGPRRSIDWGGIKLIKPGIVTNSVLPGSTHEAPALLFAVTAPL